MSRLVSDFLSARVRERGVRGRSGYPGDAIMGALHRDEDEMSNGAAPETRTSGVR